MESVNPTGATLLDHHSQSLDAFYSFFHPPVADQPFVCPALLSSGCFRTVLFLPKSWSPPRPSFRACSALRSSPRGLSHLPGAHEPRRGGDALRRRGGGAPLFPRQAGAGVGGEVGHGEEDGEVVVRWRGSSKWTTGPGKHISDWVAHGWHLRRKLELLA